LWKVSSSTTGNGFAERPVLRCRRRTRSSARRSTARKGGRRAVSDKSGRGMIASFIPACFGQPEQPSALRKGRIRQFVIAAHVRGGGTDSVPKHRSRDSTD